MTSHKICDLSILTEQIGLEYYGQNEATLRKQLLSRAPKNPKSNKFYEHITRKIWEEFFKLQHEYRKEYDQCINQ